MNKRKGSVQSDVLIVPGSQPGCDPSATLAAFRGFDLRFGLYLEAPHGKSSGLRELPENNNNA